MTEYRDLLDFARRQHRFITYRQARDRGVSKAQLRRWLEQGMVDRPFHGTYAFPGAVDDPVGVVRGATLAVGEPVLAYGRTSLWLHGALDVIPRPFELVIPHGRRAPELAGFTVHRSRTLLTQDHAWAKRVPATTVPRALADLALELPPRALHPITLDALQRRTTSLDRLTARAVERLDVRSRRGLALVIALIAPDRPDSILEAEVRERLARLGYLAAVGPITVTIEGTTVTIDIAFPDHKLGVECDGFAYHHDRAALERDHRKTNLLQLDGWIILRISWDRLWNDWEGFLQEFRTAAKQAGLQPVR